MSNYSFSKAAAAALAVAVMIPVTATMAEAKVCKSYSVSASGAKKTLNLSARISARIAWSAKVRGSPGFIWSVYAMAANKGYNCHRVGLKWRCTAYGRPCRAGN